LDLSFRFLHRRIDKEGEADTRRDPQSLPMGPEDAPMFGLSGWDGWLADAKAARPVGRAVRRARGAAAPRAIDELAGLFRLPGLGRGAVALAACLGCHDPASATAAGAVLRPLVAVEAAPLRRAGGAALAQVAAVYPGAVAGPWRWRVAVALAAQADPRLAPEAARLLARTARRRRPVPAREAHLWTELPRSGGPDRVA
jgi:hypothetical protein